MQSVIIVTKTYKVNINKTVRLNILNSVKYESICIKISCMIELKLNTFNLKYLTDSLYL